ncbi:DUF4831 domain-containing protein [Bacteroidales bacterium]|nr:DUF4831 domain-containing protein [Bacteroidales bacterium]
MKIKKVNLLVSFIALSVLLVPIELWGQTNVVKRTASKSNDYGVSYFLPKTKIILQAEVVKSDLTAGKYAKYAEKYLGINDVIDQDQTSYSLQAVQVETRGIPNLEEAYIIELKSKTIAPFVYLSEDGLICAINSDYEPSTEAKPSESFFKEKGNSISVSAVKEPSSAFTEEYLRAGSISKMAELASKQIFKLRESRMDILTGDADNAPRDGEAMKIVLASLELQEKALVELFVGREAKHYDIAEFEIDPAMEMEKEVVFRFSKYLGVVDADDLSGIPVYLTLKKLETIGAPLEGGKKEKISKGLVYNLPGRASLDVFYGTEQLYKDVIQVTQFGTTEVLATSLFEDKKGPIKIIFYPQTGTVKQIIQ